MSASSRHSGLPARLATRSQTALTTAAVARWMAPFSGPIQRSWLSPTIARQNAPRSALRRLDVEAHHQRPQRVDGRHDHLRPAPDREREPVALEAVAGVGAQDHVRRRVVRVGVHRVRAVERARGREAEVDDLEARRSASSS